jgi:chromosome segregation ATPase
MRSGPGCAGAPPQVLAAHELVFDALASSVAELCSSLLPAHELQLIRAEGSDSTRGVLLQFRFKSSEAAEVSHTGMSSPAAPCAGTWQQSLASLSGGQRTLVSLALLLAAARCSGVGASRLLLLDEVDAALDQHNAGRVAALLRSLAQEPPGTQVAGWAHNSGCQCRVLEAVCARHGTKRVCA